MQHTKEINIVFLHGWGMNQGIWHRFIKICQPLLADKYRLRSLDLPGYGEQYNSSLAPYSLQELASNIGALIKPNTVVVGWSMGGLVAQYLANLSHPKLIAHIQIASTPKFSNDAHWPGIKPDVLALFKQQLQHDSAALIKRFLAIQCLGLKDAKAQLSTMYQAVSQYPLGHSDALNAGLDLLDNTDLREDHLTLTNPSPCLRIFGALDSLIPKNAVSLIQDLYPDSQMAILPKASHAPFVSHEDEVAKLVTDFILKL
jgi:pimeloyl-[acyl-carrier protein] methyl ester esterase